MVMDQAPYLNLRRRCYLLIFLSFFSSFLFVFWSYFSVGCRRDLGVAVEENRRESDLLSFPFAWNSLRFPSDPPSRFLKIAVFVKKWPSQDHAGGLERHALTLHRDLAKRGHELHVFTASSTNVTSAKNLNFHLSNPTAAGYLDQATIWEQFRVENSSRRPFDVVHTESVGLMHFRARNHVATSDHVGDVLRRIYMLPEDRVHIILNGVDEDIFKTEKSKGDDFKFELGIQESSRLILGVAGRLVKDKGHPLIFEALKQIFNESLRFKEDVVVLVAGDGPWGARYKELGSNVRVLGPLDQAQIARFYNAIDIFVNPTLRAQGLDHTLLEAMLVGKPLMATKLASITNSVIVSQDIGYTFSPTVEALKKALHEVWKDGKVVLRHKGELARERALKLFKI